MKQFVDSRPTVQLRLIISPAIYADTLFLCMETKRCLCLACLFRKSNWNQEADKMEVRSLARQGCVLWTHDEVNQRGPWAPMQPGARPTNLARVCCLYAEHCSVSRPVEWADDLPEIGPGLFAKPCSASCVTNNTFEHTSWWRTINSGLRIDRQQVLGCKFFAHQHNMPVNAYSMILYHDTGCRRSREAPVVFSRPCGDVRGHMAGRNVFIVMGPSDDTSALIQRYTIWMPVDVSHLPLAYPRMLAITRFV